MKGVSVFLAAFAATAFAGDASVTRIDLRPSFVAREAEVRLGDVADIHSADFETIRRLVALPVGESPVAGTHAVLRRELLKRWVRLRLGTWRTPIAWQGARATVVRTAKEPSAPIRGRGSIGSANQKGVERDARGNHPPFPLVVRGDWVSLRLDHAGVELEARVQALQDGGAGDVVRVRAPTGGPLLARVIATGAVEAIL